MINRHINGESSVGDTKNFSWPSMDTPSMKAYRGPFYAIKKGQVGYK